MSRECLYELLELLKTRIQRQESVFKHTISAEERLVIIEVSKVNNMYFDIELLFITTIIFMVIIFF